MAREGRSTGLQDRRHASRLLLRPSELFLLLLAGLFFWFQPSWSSLHFAPAHFRSTVSDWVSHRTSGLKNWMSPHQRLDELNQRLSETQRRLDMAQAELRAQSLQILENDALRALFFLPNRSSYRYLHAEVVSRSLRRSDARMMVKLSDRDLRDISSDRLMGMPVIAPTDVSWSPVGRIVRLEPSSGPDFFAEIMLLSDPHSTVGVMVSDTPDLGNALLVGKGLDHVELNFAAQPLFDQYLMPNTVLVTSIESLFPPGMPVAVMRPADGGVSAGPKLSVSIGTLRFVVVMVSVSSPPDTVP